MKKYILILAFIGSVGLYGQNITDALRFSQFELGGTARFNSMSGAFGALGGDLSAISLNPAGSVIFSNNQAGFTLRNHNVNNKSNYYGTKTSQIESTLDLNQAGFVFVFENTKNKKSPKLAVSANYESTNNFDNSIFSSGVGRNSIGNYFVSYANGIPESVLANSFFEDLPYGQQQAFLGYQAFIIDPTSNNNYISNVPAVLNYFQENQFVSDGFNGRLTFNGAAQFNDIVSVGININTHFVDYRQNTSFFERNDFNNTTTTDLVNRIRFNNEIYTFGYGASLQVGTIIKPIQQIRVGLSYQSPTWYRLTDQVTQNIVAVSGNVNGELPPDFYDPQITLEFQPYNINSAGNFSGSFAYIFGKRGLISFDYIFKNHEAIKFRPDADFSQENAFIASALTNSAEYRIGGEYKIKNVSIRGGYRFDESPYRNGNTIGDLTGYSGGLGYNFGSIKLDAAYSYAQRFYNLQFFNQGFVDYSSINAKNHNISVTLLFEM